VKAFPWDEAMRLGFGVMHLSSKEFWGLTPRELSAAFEAMAGPRQSAPDRQGLVRMMEKYPDGR
jgi:uncharacterized phage protein (TIGR02216 family)